MTYEDLVKLGAKPVPDAAPAQGSGLTLEQLTAMGAKPVADASPASSTRSFYGPGSVDPSEAPVTELGKVRGFGNFAAHPKMSTDSEHDAAMQRAAVDSHLDDPGVQAIVGGVLGAGAGGVASSALSRILPETAAARTAASIGGHAIEGGVQSKAQGGSFATGALIGGGAAALPALGRVAGNAGRAIGESSIARSEARALESSAPVQDAIKKAATEIKANATKAATHAVLGEMVGGGHSMIGHGVAGLSAAYNIGRPIAQAAGTAADEGIAAIARRVLGEKAEETNPFRSELWSPRKNTPLPPSWSPRPSAAGAEPVPAIPEVAAPPVDPRIAQLQDALKTASPEQAEMINASISGLMKRGAATPRTPIAPVVQLAPSLEERATGAMGPVPELPSVHADARAAAIKSAKDALLHPEVPSEVPTFEASKYDDKFARKLKMSVDDYRAMMQERLVTAQKTLASPHASLADKLRAQQLMRGRTNVPLPGEDAEGRPELQPAN